MATIQIEGHLTTIDSWDGHGNYSSNILLDGGATRLAEEIYELGTDRICQGASGHLYGVTRDYGRVRITIEQLGRDKSSEAVAKRVVERHRGALDMLEENDAATWTPPEALVVFGKDIEAARAILRADCEAHGGVWDDSWYARPSWMPKPQSEPDMKEGTG